MGLVVAVCVPYVGDGVAVLSVVPHVAAEPATAVPYAAPTSAPGPATAVENPVWVSGGRVSKAYDVQGINNTAIGGVSFNA